MPKPYIPYVYLRDFDMVAPKDRILTMPLGQGPPFRPLASAKRGKALPVIEEMHRWMANVPGEVYANETVVQPSGAWVDIRQVPPAALVECLRFTIPRPAPVTLVFHPWTNEDIRFRRCLKLLAEVDSFNPVDYFRQGRLFIEWGVGQARNWTYCDVGPGALQIPNCSWLTVSAWTHTQPLVLAATAQIGYSHSNLDATWSCQIARDVVAVTHDFTLPPYARDATGYFDGNGLAAEAIMTLADFGGADYQEFRLRSSITPNPQTIPVHPIRVPLTGSSDVLRLRVTNLGTGAFARQTAVCTVRL